MFPPTDAVPTDRVEPRPATDTAILAPGSTVSIDISHLVSALLECKN